MDSQDAGGAALRPFRFNAVRMEESSGEPIAPGHTEDGEFSHGRTTDPSFLPHPIDSTSHPPLAAPARRSKRPEGSRGSASDDLPQVRSEFGSRRAEDTGSRISRDNPSERTRRTSTRRSNSQVHISHLTSLSRQDASRFAQGRSGIFRTSPRNLNRSSLKRPSRQVSLDLNAKQAEASEVVPAFNNEHNSLPRASGSIRSSSSLAPAHKKYRRSTSSAATRDDRRLATWSNRSSSSLRERGFNTEKQGNMEDNGSDEPTPRDNLTIRGIDAESAIAHGLGSNSLQGLLNRLGADLSEIFPGSSGGSQIRLQSLSSTISSPNPVHKKLEALSELCEFLSVGAEESLMSQSVSLCVSPLVELLHNNDNTEVRILAARALTNMMDALPSSASSIANHGASIPLCKNLLSIEYIDLAEQSLYALRKLSAEHPQKIVRADGFRAVLSFIDFFSVGIQRVAAQTFSNLCASVPQDSLPQVRESLSLMLPLLESEDRRIREHAVIGFSRLVESCKAVPQNLEMVSGDNFILLDKIIAFVVHATPQTLTSASYSAALRLLSLLGGGSVKLGSYILSSTDFITAMRDRLDSNSAFHVAEYLSIADNLLPDIPGFDAPRSSSHRHRRRPRHGREYFPSPAVNAQRRVELCRDPEPLTSFGHLLFPVLMKVQTSSSVFEARRKALFIISKFIVVTPPAVLSEVMLSDISQTKHSSQLLSSRLTTLIASLLRHRENQMWIVIGLALFDTTLNKVPKLNMPFLRQGVVYELSNIAEHYSSGEEGTVEDIPMEDITETPRDDSSDQVSGATGRSQGDQAQTVSSENNSVWASVASLQQHLRHFGGHDRKHSEFNSSADRGDKEQSESVDIFKRTCHKLASLLLKQYLEKHPQASMEGMEGDGLWHGELRTLSSRTALLRASTNPHTDADNKAVFKELLSSTLFDDSLTVFEASKSDLFEVLAMFFNAADAETRDFSTNVLLEILKHTDERISPLSSFVDLAKGVLCLEEDFDLIRTIGEGRQAARSMLAQLSNPLKIRLRKSQDGDDVPLRDFSRHIMLIEPFAPMKSLEDFLSRRSRGHEFKHVGGSHRPRNAWRALGQAGPLSEFMSQEPSSRRTFPRHRNDSLHAEPTVEHLSRSEIILDGNEEEEGSFESSEEENMEPDQEELPRNLRYSTQDLILSDSMQTVPDSPQVANVAGPSRSVLELSKDTDTPKEPASSSNSMYEPTDEKALAKEAVGGADSGDDLPRKRASRSTGRITNQNDGESRISKISFPVSSGAERRSSSRLSGDLQEAKEQSSKSTIQFSINGEALPQDCTLLSAVIRNFDGDLRMYKRLWSDIHTLTYTVNRHGSVAEAEGHAGGTENAQAAPHELQEGGLRRSKRLREKRLEVVNQTTNCDEQAHTSEDSGSESKTESPITDDVKSRTFPPAFAATVDVLRSFHKALRSVMSNRVGHDGFILSQTDFQRLEEQFTSPILSAKLMHQMSDPLVICSGMIPLWCFELCRKAPFLVPFSTRRHLFQSSALGTSRALHFFHTRLSAGHTPTAGTQIILSRGEEVRMVQLRKQKLRVHRNHILESAMKVMDTYPLKGSLLEFEYFHEVGTGLGPTLEFYTLTSRELQRNELGLWRGCKRDHRDEQSSAPSEGNYRRRVRGKDTSPSSFVKPPGSGLYPTFLNPSSKSDEEEKIAKMFKFIGRFSGKALLDGRLIDLRFSEAFCDLILAYCQVLFDSSHPPSSGKRSNRLMARLDAILDDIDESTRLKVWDLFTANRSAMELLSDVDPQLATSLVKIVDLSRSDKMSVTDLGLSFVLPGNDDAELIPNGANIDLTDENADEFVKHVQFHVLLLGVQRQTEAFLQGISEALDIGGFLLFHGRELELLLCGPSFEEWDTHLLTQVTRCDHGYTHDSPAVKFLLQVLSEMNQEDQQRFVLFATGSPALPVGGLRNLNPQLTIVRRSTDNGRSPDQCLPTVMTCTNYLKLPEYSSLKIARRQIMLAVLEGQASFHLS